MIKVDKSEVIIHATGEELINEVTMAVAMLYKSIREADIPKEEFVEMFYEMVDEAMKSVDEAIEGKDMFKKFLEFLKKEREEHE